MLIPRGIFSKNGVSCLATYAAHGNSAYDGTAGTTEYSSESKDNPANGFTCAAAPLLAGGVLTAALTRKRR